MIKRFALHAYQLKIKGLDSEEIFITADYPKDFSVFLKLLEKYDHSRF